MIDYIFLILSAVLFSTSFLGNKLFQKENGSGFRTSMQYLCICSVVVCISSLITGGGELQFTWFSLLMAVIYSANGALLTYFGIKAFKYANLSVYSMFMMLGSIVIPSVAGFMFFDEDFAFTKAICFALIFISLFLGVNKGKSNKKAIIYYILVFSLNGMAGVISKAHQFYNTMNVDTSSFLFMTGVIKFLIGASLLLGIFLKDRNEFRLPTLKSLGFGAGGGALNAIGNYFNILVLISIPISVHSVITTGGVLISSALIGLLFKEKISVKSGISLLFALAATVVSIL